MTTPEALSVLRRANGEWGAEVLFGMGSVLAIEEGEEAIEAGASFIVSPAIDDDLLRWGTDGRVLTIPGALTPTEVQRCRLAGVPLVKLFPASVLRPSYVRELRAPLPDVSVMPSGGVTIDEVGEWRRAGAVAVSLGGSLVGDALTGGDLAALASRAARAVEHWEGAAA